MPDGWGRGARVVSLHESVTGTARPTMLLLMGAVGLVLLIACVNVANLYIGRASGRGREIAVRTALGGGRGRILRLLFTESAVIALLGAAVGLALAVALLRVLVAALPAGTPRATEIALDSRVFGYTLAVTVLSTLLFGLLPAWRATRHDLASALRGAGGSGDRRQARSASWLAALQVALAVMLVSASGLLLKSKWKLQQVPLGFVTDGVLTAALPLPSFPNDTARRTPVFFASVLGRLRASDGIDGAALVSALPFGDGIQNAAMAVEAHPTAEGAPPPTPVLSLVSDGYFETMRMPLLSGRTLSAADRSGSLRVAVIDETAASTLWPTEQPVGQRIRYVWNQEWFTVVGVVGAVARDSLNGRPQPSLYIPVAQGVPRDMRLVVAASHDVGDAARVIRTAVHETNSSVPIGDVRRLADVVAGSADKARFTALLFAVFAAVALVLGAIGIYGVVSSGVLRRTREIGVRMAVGATTEQIGRMVVRETLRIAAVGTVLGAAGSVATSRWIRGLLFGVDVVDPYVLATVAAMLAVMAVVAALAPARRASRVDPPVAIRAD